MKYVLLMIEEFFGERFKHVKSLKPEWTNHARFRQYIFVRAPSFSGCCLGKKKTYLRYQVFASEGLPHAGPQQSYPVLKSH